MNQNNLLEIKQLNKQYPGVKALNDVSFSVKKGEVHGLVGANGAGKSTLNKILSGAIQPDSGQVYLGGEPILPLTPHKSQEKGIQIIYQELNLVPYLTVAENIFLGQEIRNNSGIVNDREMNREAGKILEELGVSINPNTQVWKLPVSYRQMVEVAAALHREAVLLILDETTAAITGEEIKHLFEQIRSLRDKGLGIIYVSHQIEEVFEICDRITVLRDGKYIDTKEVGQTDKNEIISMMVGRDVTDLYPPSTNELGDVLLEVNGLCNPGHFENISFNVRKGEILGFFGLVGAGRTEVVRGLFGAKHVQSGEIVLDHKEIDIKNPSAAVNHGVGLVPEDRKCQGLLLSMSVSENVTLPLIKKISSFGFINSHVEKNIVEEQVHKLQIKTPSVNQKVQFLSGGNQQKVVLAKWLATESSLLILDRPSRGIDVGAKVEIYTLMRQLAAEGHAIIMVSDELPEVLGMSDRIIVMHEGRISGVLDIKEANQKKILQLAYGEIV